MRLAGVRELVWSADGLRLATASFDQTAQVINVETGAVEQVKCPTPRYLGTNNRVLLIV